MTVMNMKILAIQNNNGYTENLPTPCSPWHTTRGLVSPTVCPRLSVILPFYMMPLNLW